MRVRGFCVAVCCAFVGSIAAPSASADNRPVGIDSELGPEALLVRLRAEETLREPTIRTEPGLVRVWFPDMRDTRMDERGDGQAVRFLQVRPGANGTAVVIVRLARSRLVLPRSAVQVDVDGGTATIQITRDALGLAAAEPATAERPPGDEESEATATETDEVESGDTPEEGDSALALTRRSDAQPIPTGHGPSPAAIIAVVCVLLGGVYFAIRRFGARGRKANQPIEVVAHKRLGRRSELLVVRALGEDHLIAVNQTTTEKIASFPSPNEESTETSIEEEFAPLLRLGTTRSTVPPREVGSRSVSERPKFGRELLSLVKDRTQNDQVTLSAASASSRPPRRNSEAVSGLLKLREQAAR